MFIMAFVWGCIVLGMVVVWFSQDLPDLNNIGLNHRRPSVVVQSDDGTILGTYGDLYEEMVRVEELPPYVPQALMAVEDKRFYSHFGVDIIGLIRAAYINYSAGRVVQGGSTLTQQLAKNILITHGNFTTNDRSFKRKIQEVILAVWLENKFTKEQILTLYLNRVYFGAATYGIDAAAQRYFNKSAKNLTVFEAAVIAGLLKAPSKYSPAHNPKLATERAKVVLSQMVEAGFIRDYKNYLQQGVEDLNKNQSNNDQDLKYFADWVYESLPQIIGEIDRDLVVTTTVDVNMQKHAMHICKHYLDTMGKELNAHQAAMVVMTPSGAVRAMVGGKSYAGSQFNRATTALRQPGSAFKTIIYQAALEKGLTTDYMIEDSPIVIGKWRPSNYKWKTRGSVSLTEAFAHSVNSVSVRLAQMTGPRNIAQVAARLGITSNLPENLSIALGTGETTLLDLTTAHATYANNGRAVWAYGIAEIRDKNGKILYKNAPSDGDVIVETRVLQGMRTLLRAVVARGSGRAANVDETVSGKTGSNGDKDAWFFAYRENPESEGERLGAGYNNVVVGVWIGNDDGRIHKMKKASTGGRIPARIAGSFFKGEFIDGLNLTKSGNAVLVNNQVNDDNEESDSADQALDEYLKNI